MFMRDNMSMCFSIMGMNNYVRMTITGSDYDVYYRGWAEDYPKDPSTLKKMYNNLEKKFGKLKNIKK